MNMERNWDVICVGAGITSLAFASLAIDLNPQLKILLIEKHNIPGGYATVFQREEIGAQFDCSLHKLSGMSSDGGNLIRIFQKLGLDQALTIRSDQLFFNAVFDQFNLEIPNQQQATIARLKEQFPDDEAGIDHFFSDVDSHGKNAYYQFQILDGSYSPDFDQLRYARRHLHKLTLSDALDGMIKHQALKHILSAPAIYVGAFPEQISYLYYLHIVYATLSKGNAFLAGGSSQDLSDALREKIEHNGSKVLLSTRVKSILTDNSNRAIGVDTKRGKFFADQIYINASPHHTMEKLLPQTAQVTEHSKKLDYVRPSQSTTTLYVTTTLPPDQLDLTGAETMLFSADYDRSVQARRGAQHTDPHVCEQAYWLDSPMEITNYHSINPRGGYVLILNVLDDIRHWPLYKSAAYHDKKQRAVDAMLARLITAFPRVKEAIQYFELSTPRTYLRYTNNTAGAGYGAIVDTSNNPNAFQAKFPIKNLQFISAWVAGPSYEAAFGFAEMKANQLLQRLAAQPA